MSGVRDYDSAISFSEIVDYCVGEIANFKVTRYVDIVEELPMTQSDKIQKFRLRKTLKKAIEAGTLVRLKLSKKSPEGLSKGRPVIVEKVRPEICF